MGGCRGGHEELGEGGVLLPPTERYEPTAPSVRGLLAGVMGSPLPAAERPVSADCYGWLASTRPPAPT